MNEPPTEAEFPLRLSTRKSIEMVGIVIVLIVAFVFLAIYNRKGLDFIGLFTLIPEQASLLFWGFAIFFGVGGLPFSLALVWKLRFAGQHIGFTEGGIWVPRSVWSSIHVWIANSDIHGIRIVSIRHSRVIELWLPGRKFWISENAGLSLAAFEEILGRLQKALKQHAAPDTPEEPPAN
jgi:hypothetical protein